jgi:alpha-tubulin suppressor-like RCC1 family protein
VRRGRVLGAVLVLLCAGTVTGTGVAAVDPTVAGRLAVGDDHVCALTASGGIVCWGSGENSQVPLPALSSDLFAAEPVALDPLPEGRRGVQISAGAEHTCVRAHDGTVWCWGSNGYGQLANSFGDSTDPSMVTLPAAAVLVAAGARRVMRSTNRRCRWRRRTWSAHTYRAMASSQACTGASPRYWSAERSARR